MYNSANENSGNSRHVIKTPSSVEVIMTNVKNAELSKELFELWFFEQFLRVKCDFLTDVRTFINFNCFLDLTKNI